MDTDFDRYDDLLNSIDESDYVTSGQMDRDEAEAEAAWLKAEQEAEREADWRDDMERDEALYHEPWEWE